MVLNKYLTEHHIALGVALCTRPTDPLKYQILVFFHKNAYHYIHTLVLLTLYEFTTCCSNYGVLLHEILTQYRCTKHHRFTRSIIDIFPLTENNIGSKYYQYTCWKGDWILDG